MAWTIKSKLDSTQEIMEWIQGSASTAYVKDSLVMITAGLPVTLTGQTGQPYGVAQEIDIQPYNGQSSGNVNGANASPLRPSTADQMTTTTVGEKLGIVPVTPGLLLDTDVVPLLNRVAAKTNATAGAAVCTAAGSDDDYNGGIIYLPDQDWQAVITDVDASAGDLTFTFAPPAPRACTVGDVISAMPFGLGFAPKFSAAAPHLTLSNTVADNSGGNVLVRKVAGQHGSLKGSLFRVTCEMKSPVQ